MLLVAEHGISSGAIMDFALNRDDEQPSADPGAHSPGPVYVEGWPRTIAARSSRRGSTSFRCAPSDEPAQGLLLVGGPGQSWTRKRRGSGARSASRCRDSLGRQLLAETRFGQERMLLYSIINAVTDPILLTDTEGKLIIVSSHAEKLFGAPEEASEAGAGRAA